MYKKCVCVCVYVNERRCWGLNPGLRDAEHELYH